MAVLSHAENMEKGVLSSMLQGKGPAIDKVDALSPDAFYNPINRTIFAHLVTAHRGGMPVDLILFQQSLENEGVLDQIGGAAYLTELQTFAPSDCLLDFYVDELQLKWRDRQLAHLAQSIIPGETTPADIRAKLDEIERNKSQQEPLVEFRSPIQLKNFSPPPGLVMVGDCHIVRGSVFVIGGAPGIGKSRAAVAIAEAGATGDDWFGLDVHRQFKTMIVQTENGEFSSCEGIRRIGLRSTRELRPDMSTAAIWALF